MQKWPTSWGVVGGLYTQFVVLLASQLMENARRALGDSKKAQVT